MDNNTFECSMTPPFWNLFHRPCNTKIIDEKIQYNINNEAANISGLSSSKIDKYEFPTGWEVLPADQSKIKEQAKFT